MSDIALFFSQGSHEYDITIRDGDILTGNDLESAVLVSLFTWARATTDEVDEKSARYGWWGDRVDDDSTDNIGSKLYLLKREKITDETIIKAKEYIQQALKWLIDDNVASTIDITTERNSNDKNRIDAIVVITRGDSTKTLRFNDLWSLL